MSEPSHQFTDCSLSSSVEDLYLNRQTALVPHKKQIQVEKRTTIIPPVRTQAIAIRKEFSPKGAAPKGHLYSKYVALPLRHQAAPKKKAAPDRELFFPACSKKSVCITERSFFTVSLLKTQQKLPRAIAFNEELGKGHPLGQNTPRIHSL